VLAAVGLLSGTVAAQTITEFSDGITPGAQPLGITAGPDGNLWFAEQGADRIGRITPSGVVTEFSEGIAPGSAPAQITVGADGNLWFTESGGSRIGRITPQGVITELATRFTGFGIAAGVDGNVWFTEKMFMGGIERITPTGIVTRFGAPNITMRDQITAGPDGNLWVTETFLPMGVNVGFSIWAVSTDGEYLLAGPGSGAAQSPGGITVGPDSNLWVTRTVPTYAAGAVDPGLWIDKMTVNGVLTSYFTGLPVPRRPDPGITLGPDGNLWFTADSQISRRTARSPCSI
jgi:streptogramin lyase